MIVIPAYWLPRKKGVRIWMRRDGLMIRARAMGRQELIDLNTRLRFKKYQVWWDCWWSEDVIKMNGMQGKWYWHDITSLTRNNAKRLLNGQGLWNYKINTDGSITENGQRWFRGLEFKPVSPTCRM